jgi:hypothetical protein
MKAKEFDQKFDDGLEDINDDLDLSTARRVNEEPKHLNAEVVTQKDAPESDCKKLKSKR